MCKRVRLAQAFDSSDRRSIPRRSHSPVVRARVAASRAMAQRALREFDAKAMVARLLPEYLGDGAWHVGAQLRPAAPGSSATVDANVELALCAGGTAAAVLRH